MARNIKKLVFYIPLVVLFLLLPFIALYLIGYFCPYTIIAYCLIDDIEIYPWETRNDMYHIVKFPCYDDVYNKCLAECSVEYCKDVCKESENFEACYFGCCKSDEGERACHYYCAKTAELQCEIASLPAVEVHRKYLLQCFLQDTCSLVCVYLFMGINLFIFYAVGKALKRGEKNVHK